MRNGFAFLLVGLFLIGISVSRQRDEVALVNAKRESALAEAELVKAKIELAKVEADKAAAVVASQKAEQDGASTTRARSSSGSRPRGSVVFVNDGYGGVRARELDPGTTYLQSVGGGYGGSGR